MLNPISHAHEFIFVNSGKCGSSSVQSWFYQFLADAGEREAGQAVDLPWFIASRFCVGDFDVERFPQHRKILFIRNPWQRVVSGYYHLVLRALPLHHQQVRFARGRTLTLNAMMLWSRSDERASFDWSRRLSFREFVCFLEENLEPFRRMVHLVGRELGSHVQIEKKLSELGSQSRAALARKFEPLLTTDFLSRHFSLDAPSLLEAAIIVIYHVGVISTRLADVRYDRIVDLAELDAFLKGVAEELGISVNWSATHRNVTEYVSRSMTQSCADLGFQELEGLGYNPGHRQFYDDSLVETVARCYRPDIERMGYRYG